MKNPLMFLLVFSIGSLALLGCGSAGGGGDTDYQAGGERLSLVGVTPVEGTGLTINVVKETNDFGDDNTANTDDRGEDDGIPDANEDVLTEVTDFYATLALENIPRAQSTQSTDLIVTMVDVTYIDASGGARFRTNRQFPTGTVTIKPGETGDVTINLFPLAVIAQSNPPGPEAIFLTKNNSLIDPIRTMRAVLDIYAEDVLNSNNEVHIQKSVSIALQNPMEHR